MTDERSLLTRRRMIAGGIVIAVGGTGIWTFRPPPVRSRDEWREISRLPMARGEMKAAVFDDRIYVPGGMSGLGTSTDRLSVYDPAIDSWETAASMPIPLNHHAVAVLDGTIYVVGGNREFADAPEAHVVAYDPRADAWHRLADLPEGRWGHELVAFDGRLYLIGGKTTETQDVLIFDGDGWDRGAPMPTPRDHLAAGVVGDRILAVGGRWNGENLGTVEAYVPETDRWSRVESEPEPRSGTGHAVIDGRFYLAGGEDPATISGWTTDRHEFLDGSRWSDGDPLPLPLHGSASVVHDDRFVVIGGAWRHGILSVTAWSDRVFVFDP